MAFAGRIGLDDVLGWMIETDFNGLLLIYVLGYFYYS
jgi:hypothetical protein